MPKRRYTKMETIKEEMIKMRQAGAASDEIATEFELTVRQVVNFFNRQRHTAEKLAQGMVPNQKGRPRKRSELEQLRMENKLLRDFMQFTERM